MADVFELKGTIKIEGADAVKATIKDTAASVDDSTSKMGDSSEQLAAEFEKNTEQINENFDDLEKKIKETAAKSEQNFNKMKRDFNTLGTSMVVVSAGIIASLTGIAMTAMNNQEAIDKMSTEDQINFSEMQKSWADMKQAALDLTMTIGSALAPVFTGLYKIITDIINPIREWVAENQTLVTVLAAILIPLAGIVGALGSFMLLAVKLAAFMKAWQALTIAQTISQWALNAAMYANPIGLIVAAIAAVIAVVVVVITHFDTIKRWFLQGWDVIKAAFQKVIDWFKAGWDKIKNAFLFVWNSIHNAFGAVMNGIMAGVEGFVNFFIRGVNFIIEALNRLQVNIPSWVPLVGGQTWGINISPIPEVSLPRVEMKEVPTLDTGAYVSPRAGGTIARLAASGEGEWVMTNSQLAAVTNNSKMELHIHMEGSEFNIPDESYLEKLTDKLSAKIAGRVNLQARYV
ncbi:MAG: hypothetical protein M0R06_00620 [Sphaerochaeta sp.]|jgi:hypothetical protein|nr:hypothetical protein [Sphaerochaeta sp.]